MHSADTALKKACDSYSTSSKQTKVRGDSLQATELEEGVKYTAKKHTRRTASNESKQGIEKTCTDSEQLRLQQQMSFPLVLRHPATYTCAQPHFKLVGMLHGSRFVADYLISQGALLMCG